MDTNQNQNSQAQLPAPKHLKTFWSIFIIVVVSLIAGGAIMYFISDNNRQEELNSIFFVGRGSDKAAVPANKTTK